MSAHTPAPWFGGTTIRDGLYCIVGDGDSVVCEFVERSGKTLEADARLISWAPELLALAEAIADNIIICDTVIGREAQRLIAKINGDAA